MFDIGFQGVVVFGLDVRFYSVMILAGLVAGIILAHFRAKGFGENPDHVLNIAVIGAAFGLIGARLYHVIDLWSYYSANPLQIFAFRSGGIGIFGAIAGAALALVVYVWWVNRRARAGRGDPIRALRWFDIGAPAFLLGQAVGRWGNFFNKELFGPETTLPWGIPIYDAGANFPWDATTAPRHHPLFLYESLLSLLGVVVLLWVGRKFALRLRQGDVLFFYFIWYALERSALELLRSDNWRLGAVPVAHIASAVLIAVALAALVLWRNRRPYLDGAPSRDGTPSRDGNASRAVAPNAPGGAEPRSRAAQRRASRRAASSDDDGSAPPDGGAPAGG